MSRQATHQRGTIWAAVDQHGNIGRQPEQGCRAPWANVEEVEMRRIASGKGWRRRAPCAQQRHRQQGNDRATANTGTQVAMLLIYRRAPATQNRSQSPA